MLRFAGRTAAAALVLSAWSGERSAAQPPPPRETGLIDALLAPKPEPKPEPVKDKGPRKPTTNRAAKDAAAVRAKEEADFLRRLAVCDRLRELALETQDEALMKQADLVEEQAREVYARRTAHLPSARVAAERPLAQRDEERAATAELVDAYLGRLSNTDMPRSRTEGAMGPARERKESLR